MSHAFSRVWILIIFVAFLIVGGFFAWQYFGPQKESGKIDTSNWQTYRNDDIKFEVLLPADWKVSEESRIMTRGITSYVMFERGSPAPSGRG